MSGFCDAIFSMHVIKIHNLTNLLLQNKIQNKKNKLLHNHYKQKVSCYMRLCSDVCVNIS